MPSAGFYSIHTSKLSFRSDGRWYADAEPVVHERLARLFSRYLRRKPGGGYEIWIDERYHADVEVEDTPFVVVRVECRDNGTYHIELNDGRQEALNPRSLAIGDSNVLYLHIRTGERARVLRAAYYQLAEAIEEAPGGGFAFRCGLELFPISGSAK